MFKKVKEKWNQISQSKMPRIVVTLILSVAMLLTILPFADVFAVAVTQVRKVDLPVYLGSDTGISDYMHIYVMRDPQTGDPVYCTRKGATLPSNSFELTADDINNNPLLFYRLKSIYDNGRGWTTGSFLRTTPNVNGVDYSGASTYFGYITNQIAIWMVLGEMAYQSGSLVGGTYDGKDIYEAYTSGTIKTINTATYNTQWTASQNIPDTTAKENQQSYLNDVHNASTILYSAKQIADAALAQTGSYTMNPIICKTTLANKTDWTATGSGTYTATITANVDNGGTWIILAGDYTNCSVSTTSGASGAAITVTATEAQKQAGAHIKVSAVVPKDDASADVLSFFTSNGQSFITMTNGHIVIDSSPDDADWSGSSGPTQPPAPTGGPEPTDAPTPTPEPTGHGSINIYKSKYALSNPSGTMAPESGAMFAVFDSDGNNVDIITTDGSGMASSSQEYPMGTYTIMQMFSSANYFTFTMGYSLSFTVVEGEGQSFSFSASNIIYEQYIRVLKTDSETGAVERLAGATFEVLASDGATVLSDSNGNTEFTTDASGTVALTDLPLVVGSYYIKEIQAPIGYVLNENLLSFSVSIFEHGTGAVTVENSKDVKNIYFADKPQKCEIQIEKYGDYLYTTEKIEALDSAGVRLTDINSNPLSIYNYFYIAKEKTMAIFEVTVGDKDIVDQDGNLKLYDADKDGVNETPLKAGTSLGLIKLFDPTCNVMTNLPLDGITATAEYYVTETEPPFGDLLAGRGAWLFTYADQHIEIIINRQQIYDARQKLQVKIQKYKEQGVWNADKNDYDWIYVPAEGILFGLYTKDNVYGDLGSVQIPAGTLVDVLKTDSTGVAVTTKDITFGSYYVKEINVTPDVVIDERPFDVSAMPVDQKSAAATVTTANGTQPLINKAVAGKVNIYKLAADTTLPMPGVVFEVYNKDGILVDTVTTDANGHAITRVMPYGQYTLIETKTLTGYALADKQTIHINVSQLMQRDGDTFSEADFVIADQKMAQVEVFKVTGDGTQTPMDGVVFGIYNSITNAETARITTDSKGYGSVYIMPGDYYLQEISTWEGYSLSAEKIPITAEFAHLYTFHKTNSLTELRVKKTGTDGTSLAGMKFTVTDTATGQLVSLVFDKDKNAYVAQTVLGVTREMSLTKTANTTAITGKYGVALILGLKPGTYTITEIQAPSGYNLDSKPTNTVIREAGVLGASLIIENTPRFPKTGESDKKYNLTHAALYCIVFALAAILFLVIRRIREKPGHFLR